MIEVITETLQDEIDAQTVTRPPANGCPLACRCWDRRSRTGRPTTPSRAPGLMIAAATPRCGVVVHANAWSAFALRT